MFERMKESFLKTKLLVGISGLESVLSFETTLAAKKLLLFW
jgi:hypothetical protein